MCSESPAVDPGVGLAAQANAAVAADTLAWYKAKDAEMKPYRDKAIQMAMDQADIQTQTAAKQNAMADETYNYTKNTFRPLEQKIAGDALAYDTPERRAQEAAQAQADAGSATDAMRGNIARDVAARGGDVNSGNFMAGMGRMSIDQAAKTAAAGNQARKNVEAIGSAKLADAAALGRGIASTNATQTQLGLQAGNSAVGNAQVPGNIAAQQGTMMAQGANTAIAGNNSSGNLLLGQYQAQNAAANQDSGLWGALGQAGGAAIMKWSDVNMKEDIEPVDPNKALEAVEKTPVSEWKYKDGSAGADGGKKHVGPMAQDVNATMGEATAPRGRAIDIVSMSGTMMAAIKGLSNKVNRIAAASGISV